MCDFCDNIKDAEWYKEHSPYERNNAIVQTGEKTFGLWIECDDCYYSGIAIRYINFCPMCGANLELKTEKNKKRKENSFFQKYGFDF